MKHSRIFLIAGLGAASLGSLLLLGQQPAGQPAAQVRGNEGAGSTIFGNTCQGCHGKLDSAPPPAMLKKLTPEKIYEALTTGNMKNQAADLTDIQKRDIAEWVSGRKLGAAQSGDIKAMTNRCASNPPIKDLTSTPGWNGWSPDLVNHRLQSAKAANISAASV